MIDQAEQRDPMTGETVRRFRVWLREPARPNSRVCWAPTAQAAYDRAVARGLNVRNVTPAPSIVDEVGR